MAKRFIKDEMLRNPWLRSATTIHKVLWVALITECDHAGIWIVDWEMMNLLCGGEIDRAAAARFLDGRFIEIDNGRRWFIPDFIRFQYPNGLMGENNNLKSIRSIFSKYGICAKTLTILNPRPTLGQPLTNPRPTLDQGLQEMEEEREGETIEVLDMSNTTHISSENQNFGFDAEKRYRQFEKIYAKPGKYQPALRAYVAAILHLGRAPTHYPPIAAAKLLEDQAAASRLYDVRTEQTKRCNPETWLENQSYLTDWKSALETYLNDRNTQENGKPRSKSREYVDQAQRVAEESGL
ncbi:MAG: hypothetical protein E6Q97_36985 [Desulfurellales bacterium]|nr:MAG: hypothetical protein E6Q97_36985 [Desulfurellales bacterium]